MDTRCSKCGQEDANAYEGEALLYFCDNCAGDKIRIGAPTKTELRKQLDAFSEFDRQIKKHSERLKALEAENKGARNE